MSTQLYRCSEERLTIAGSDSTFCVKRIYCVGRNYAEHAREMGKDPDRDPPFFFMKPASALVPAGGSATTIPYPPRTNQFHHEIELVAAIGVRAECVSPDDALRCVVGYAVGLDMTRRDLQLAAREMGRPWELGKSFAHSAPVGNLQPVEQTGHIQTGAIWLDVNGKPRQRADIADLIWSVAECIACLSEFDPLEPGDLLFTGTPAGVGPVVPGDVLRGGVTGVGTIELRITEPRHARS